VGVMGSTFLWNSELADELRRVVSRGLYRSQHAMPSSIPGRLGDVASQEKGMSGMPTRRCRGDAAKGRLAADSLRVAGQARLRRWAAEAPLLKHAKRARGDRISWSPQMVGPSAAAQRVFR
jgi:hypothetical protein